MDLVTSLQFYWFIAFIWTFAFNFLFLDYMYFSTFEICDAFAWFKCHIQGFERHTLFTLKCSSKWNKRLFIKVETTHDLTIILSIYSTNIQIIWNSQYHGQTIHLTENFISQIFCKISCILITFLPPTSRRLLKVAFFQKVRFVFHHTF